MQTHPKPRSIDVEVSRMIDELSKLEAGSKEYEATAKNLEIICRARSCKASNSINIDTVIMAGTNILGILLILNYEDIHVITSKALSFVAKGRV